MTTITSKRGGSDEAAQAPAVDMLICAVALRRGMSIFTTDPDSDKYAGVLAIRLHSVSGD
jgi:predicted nucleic acid-binding protein